MKLNRLAQYEKAVAEYLEAYHNYHNIKELDGRPDRHHELKKTFDRLCELDSTN